MKTPRACRVLVLLSLVLGGTAASQNDDDHPTAELVKQVRQAVGQFQDVQLAVAAGYEPGPCVSGPNGGAMGIHYINPNFLDDAAPVLAEPEALVYEPRPNGRLRLVAVEYITLAGPAVLEGHLLNFVGSPNRYGLPEFYELHVWAWRENPDGTFADWNPRVSCDAVPVS